MIGSEFKKYRKEKGITQVEMAKELGVTPQYICNIERGASISDKMKNKFAEYLKIDIELIISEKKVCL